MDTVTATGWYGHHCLVIRSPAIQNSENPNLLFTHLNGRQLRQARRERYGLNCIELVTMTIAGPPSLLGYCSQLGSHAEYLLVLGCEAHSHARHRNRTGYSTKF